MACCSGCVGYPAAERQFGPAVAERDLDRYHRKGPDAISRLLLARVTDHLVAGESLLDVGAGVGVISFELLAKGVGRTTLVDASPAYLDAAEGEAERRKQVSAIARVDGDFVLLASGLDPADIVAMHRVICCYPDAAALLENATRLCGRLLAISYPRDEWYVRSWMRVENLRRRVLSNAFRSFVHSAVAMEAHVVNAGFQRLSRGQTLAWCVDVYARRHAA